KQPLELLSLVSTARSSEQLYAGLVAWLTSRRGCPGAGIYMPGPQGLAPAHERFDGPMFDAANLQEAITHAAQSAAATAKTCVERSVTVRNLSIVAVPVVIDDRKVGAIVAALVSERDAVPDDAALLTAAAYAALWSTREQNQRARRDLSLTAATLDLLSTISACDNFLAAKMELVNGVRDHLGTAGIVLGLVQGRSNNCRVAAISGLATFDMRGGLTRTLASALDESILRDRLSQSPHADTQDRDGLRCHDALRLQLQAARVVSFPLKTADGRTVGAWLAIEETEPAAPERVETFLRAAAPRVAATLGQAQRAEQAWLRNGSSLKSTGRRLLVCGLLASVVAAVLMIPLPYQVYCKCAAEPDLRRYIVAPHDGLIERPLVEPGDVVHQGQVLAHMDGRDLRWELSGLVAGKYKAAKEQDTYLLKGDVGASQKAAFEVQRLEAREQVLLRQQDELDICSPIAGVVLEGHLERVENAPVTIGQPLYEVAPLSPVNVEVAIPHDELVNVPAGARVSIRFDGVDQDFTGTIRRTYPRSEVREGDNVFIAEVELPNTDSILRPGMSGYARIVGPTRALGWNLFHKPWEHLRKLLPI
ncbi:MAG: efflux RND transporter periplasmic adaptor subunit, partial [Planctomycetaceae bacterium]